MLTDSWAVDGSLKACMIQFIKTLWVKTKLTAEHDIKTVIYLNFDWNKLTAHLRSNIWDLRHTFSLMKQVKRVSLLFPV